MNDTMSSGEAGSDRDDETEGSESATDGGQPEPEEELDDTASDGSTDGDDDSGDGSDAAPDDQAGEESGEPDEPDRELAKVAGSDPPDPRKLDEVDGKIGSARSTAEDVVAGVRDDDQPDYHESGEEKPDDADDESADDQAITPPG